MDSFNTPEFAPLRAVDALPSMHSAGGMNVAPRAVETAANSDTVNAMAHTGADHAINTTANVINGIAGTALHSGLEWLPPLGVIGIACWGFRKMYEGVFGLGQRTKIA